MSKFQNLVPTFLFDFLLQFAFYNFYPKRVCPPLSGQSCSFPLLFYITYFPILLQRTRVILVFSFIAGSLMQLENSGFEPDGFISSLNSTQVGKVSIHTQHSYSGLDQHEALVPAPLNTVNTAYCKHKDKENFFLYYFNQNDPFSLKICLGF